MRRRAAAEGFDSTPKDTAGKKIRRGHPARKIWRLPAFLCVRCRRAEPSRQIISTCKQRVASACDARAARWWRKNASAENTTGPTDVMVRVNFLRARTITFGIQVRQARYGTASSSNTIRHAPSSYHEDHDHCPAALRRGGDEEAT